MVFLLFVVLVSNDVNIDCGWMFFCGDQFGVEVVVYDDFVWWILDLLYDWSIEDLLVGEGIVGLYDWKMFNGLDVGYVCGGVGWYCCIFMDVEWFVGFGLELIVYGVQQECDIWVNGMYVVFQLYGYILVCVEIGWYLCLCLQINVIVVCVLNFECNLWWYFGLGFY